MKRLITCIIFSLPIFLLAQGDDYCSCLDDKINYEDLTQYIFLVNKDIEGKSLSPPKLFMPYLLPEKEKESMIFEEKVEVMVPVEQKNIEISIDETPSIEKKIMQVQDRKLTRSTSLKKRKKQDRVRLKPRKKRKKYKGQCPIF